MVTTVSSFSVNTDENRSWEEMLKMSAPNTPKYNPIYKIGNQYISQDYNGFQEVFIVNFEKDIKGMDVMLWAGEHNYKYVSPRLCFAIPMHYNLIKELGVKSLGLLSFDFCSDNGQQRVCRVWIESYGREADLAYPYGLFNSIHWFAFLKQNNKPHSVKV